VGALAVSALLAPAVAATTAPAAEAMALRVIIGEMVPRAEGVGVMATSVEEELVAAEKLEAAGTAAHRAASRVGAPLVAALGAAWVAAMETAVAEVA